MEEDSNKENFNKFHLKELEINKRNWSNILLGNQFLKLYFLKNGISNSLVVDRLIKLDHLKIKKSNEKFKFAIVRSRENTKNLGEDGEKNEDEKVEDKRTTYSRIEYENYENVFDQKKFLFFSKIKNYFPSKEMDFDIDDFRYRFKELPLLETNNEKILNLAYSGFYNLYCNSSEASDEDTSKLFEKQNTPLIKFFKKMNSFVENTKAKDILLKKFQDKILNNSDNANLETPGCPPDKAKVYYDHEILSHYAEQMLKIDMSNQHHNSTKAIRGDNVYPLISQNDYEGNFSLFFLDNEILYEWREFSGELLKVGKSVKQEFARDLIFDYIKTCNNESEVLYESDITIFAELTDQPLDNFKAESNNCCLTFILAIVFLINFFLTIPENTFYTIKDSLQDGLNIAVSAGYDLNLKSLSNKDELQNYFLFNVMKVIYNEANINHINKLTSDVSNLISQSGMSVSNVTVSNKTGSYLKDINIYSGMLINFKIVSTQNATTISNRQYSGIPKSHLNYYDVDQKEDLTQDFSNYEIKQSDIPDMLGLYEYYANPQTTSYESMERITKLIFNEKIGKFIYSIMVYNKDFETLSIFTFELEYDSFGNLNILKYFDAMKPHFTRDTGTMLIAIILSAIIILGNFILSISYISLFINSIIESINTKSNSLKLYELFDLFTIVIIIISQIFFLIVFIFSRDVFPFIITNNEDFIFWMNKLNTHNTWQNITGVAIFFMIFQLLRYFMVSFPSFGIVFQTFHYAHGEILTFFILICIVLGGVACLAHSSFGYYSPDFTNISFSYFNVYLMFLGIFDYSSIYDKKFSNELAPYFLVIFMIIFYLILINLFISTILNNYEHVKEKYQKFNDVYTVLLQETIEDLTQKIINLFICKHPQEVEHELKLKRKIIEPRINKLSENDENNSNNNNQDDQDDSKNKKDQNHEAQSLKIGDVTIWDKITYNFKRLELRKMFFGDSMKNEEFQEKKKDFIQKMEEQNLEEMLSNFTIDYDKEFDYLNKTLLGIAYIIIFIFMMDYQLRIKYPENVSTDFFYKIDRQFSGRYEKFSNVESEVLSFIDNFYKMNKTNSIISTNNTSIVNDSLSKNSTNNTINKNNTTRLLSSYEYLNTFNQDHFVEYVNMEDGAERILQASGAMSSSNPPPPQNTNSNTSNSNVNNTPTMDTGVGNATNLPKVSNSTNNSSTTNTTLPSTKKTTCDTEIDQLHLSNYILLNSPFFRFTFRLYSVNFNENQYSKSYFPYTKSVINPLNQAYCSNQGEFINDIELKPSIDNILKYDLPETGKAWGDCGGFVLLLGRWKSDCQLQNPLDENIKGQMKAIFNMSNLASFFIDFAVFSLYEDYAVLLSMAFVKNQIGVITNTFEYKIVPINRYVSYNDFIRTVLECLYLILSAIIIFLLLQQISMFFIDFYKRDYDSDPNKETFKDSSFLNKFFRIDFNAFKNEGMLKSFCKMIFIIIKKILLAILWVINSVIIYLRSDGYNILDFAYAIILISMIFTWYDILAVTQKLNFQNSLSYDPTNSINIAILSNLVKKYDSYYFFQGLNGFFLFLRILKIFKFSQSINNLMTVIYKAKAKVVFHIVAMIIFNFGYCFCGFCLFSDNVYQFSTISSSFLQIIFIIAGNVDINIFTDVSKPYSTIWIIAITFTNCLILLNILLAIVVQSFIDVKNENKINYGKELNESFLQKIIDISYKKILLIYQRLDQYYYDISYYFYMIQENITQFQLEIEDGQKKNTNNDKNKNKIIQNTAKLGYYDLYRNMKKSIEEICQHASDCEFTDGLIREYSQENKNSENNLFKIYYVMENKKPDIGILENIFVYIYFVLLEKEPDVTDLFALKNKNKTIERANEFYDIRFSNDKSYAKFSQPKSKIWNSYIKGFMSKFKTDIINKPDSYFKKNYHEKMKNYISEFEKCRKVNTKPSKTKYTNLFYSTKSLEPLENFENCLYQNEIYKIKKINYNSFLNTIIYRTPQKKNLSQSLDFYEFNKIHDINDISYNQNFADILSNDFKLLKHLKFATITYDLIVKYYYMPKDEVGKAKEAYFSFYMKKFLEQQFNQLEIQYFTNNIPKIKDNLFENDIKRLLMFDFDTQDTKYGANRTFEEYVKDDQVSLRNAFFDNETNPFNSQLEERFKSFISETFNLCMKTEITKYNINHSLNKMENMTDQGFTDINYNKNNKDNQNTNKESNNISPSPDGMAITKADASLLEFKENCLKFFTIWNTMFIIFFRKNFKYVRFLERLSYCDVLLNKYFNTILAREHDQNDICFKSPCLFIFTSVFFLDKNIFEDKSNNAKKNQNKNKESSLNANVFIPKKIDNYLQQYNETRLLNQIDESEDFSPQSCFYNNLNDYLFNISDENYQKNIKEDNQKSLNSYHIPSRFTDYYPLIFSQIWNFIDEHTKKTLFFGLNEQYFQYFLKNEISVFSNPLLYESVMIDFKDAYSGKNKNNKKPKIVKFFKTEHKSHIFYILDFPKFNFPEIKKAIIAYNNQIPAKELDKIETPNALFKLLYLINIPIKKIYDIYNMIFNKHFKDLKPKIKECITAHEILLEKLVKNNPDFFDNPVLRIKFMKFFKYVLSMKKFDIIKKFIDFSIKTQLTVNNEIDRLDEIETIRRCENEDIKQTFTFFYLYFYSGTKDFESGLKYLDKNIKTRLTFKFEKYGRLLDIKDKIKIFDEKLNTSDKKFSNMHKYKDELIQKIKDLEYKRNMIIKDLNRKIESEKQTFK